MSNYPTIQTIRYMGNKGKLLDYIIPEIEKLTQPGDTVCDIMAGTNSIGYALKSRNIIISNDIQYYSYVIAQCLLDNYDIPNISQIHSDIDTNYNLNKENHYYSFFIDNYTDTYFSEPQCLEIDSLRYAIEKVSNEQHKNFYLTLLMNAMCKAQSTTGHFAQFLDSNHKRTITLRKLSVYKLFFEKVSDFSSFVKSNYCNCNFNLDYNELFLKKEMNDVKCFYLDSPYTSDQYSRFYHILETICKYDRPDLSFKAKYRSDRVQSKFCYKKSVLDEFERIISFCASKKASLVISYSNHGVANPSDIVDIANKYFSNVVIKDIDFDHSSQGKGTIRIKEVLIIME